MSVLNTGRVSITRFPGLCDNTHSVPSMRLAADSAPSSVDGRAGRVPRPDPAESTAVGGTVRLLVGYDRERAHHLLVLVFENVAVPRESTSEIVERHPDARRLRRVHWNDVLGPHLDLAE